MREYRFKFIFHKSEKIDEKKYSQSRKYNTFNQLNNFIYLYNEESGIEIVFYSDILSQLAPFTHFRSIQSRNHNKKELGKDIALARTEKESICGNIKSNKLKELIDNCFIDKYKGNSVRKYVTDESNINPNLQLNIALIVQILKDSGNFYGNKEEYFRGTTQSEVQERADMASS